MSDLGTALIFFGTFLMISFMRSGDLKTVILAVAAEQIERRLIVLAVLGLLLFVLMITSLLLFLAIVILEPVFCLMIAKGIIA
jgi:hypothetical protein